MTANVVKPLTSRQRDVLRVIVRFTESTGEAPSARYVARRLGLHLTTVQEHLQAMHEKGWLSSPSPAGIRCLDAPEEADGHTPSK
jgi:Mn-dependent DtxR family transcriptional regulator